MNEDDRWIAVALEDPPEGVLLDTTNGSRVQPLIYEQGQWWLPDRSMYVYYTPMFWRAQR